MQLKPAPDQNRFFDQDLPADLLTEKLLTEKLLNSLCESLISPAETEAGGLPAPVIECDFD